MRNVERDIRIATLKANLKMEYDEWLNKMLSDYGVTEELLLKYLGLDYIE